MKLFASIAVIANKVKEDYVSAFAAQAALFVIMSFVPFLILLLTLIKYTPLTEEVLLQFVTNFAPDAFEHKNPSSGVYSRRRCAARARICFFWR